MDINNLKAGASSFNRQLSDTERQQFKDLAKGQQPKFLFLTCADSRLDPSLFTQTNPGDLFVVRNVGNMIPFYNPTDHTSHSEMSAIEFGIKFLGIKQIVICGHSNCGAMAGLLEKVETKPYTHLHSWLELGQASKKAYLSQDCHRRNSLPDIDALSQVNVIQQVENLKSYPWLAQLIQENKLEITLWWFDIAHAQLEMYDNTLNKFTPI